MTNKTVSDKCIPSIIPVNEPNLKKRTAGVMHDYKQAMYIHCQSCCNGHAALLSNPTRLLFNVAF